MNVLQKLISAAAMSLLFSNTADAVSTPFTYQGFLEDNALPANGVYDFQFVLKFPSGSDVTAPITMEDVSVVAGVFNVQLDFGVFNGNDRLIGISVRPGASSGAFTALLPNAPLNAPPLAQFSNDAGSASIADDVIDNAIDEIEINNDAVSSRNIIDGAITSTDISDNTIRAADIGSSTITASELAADSVGASELAADSVDASELAADSVGASELANNSVGLNNLIGANYTSPANFNATINANSCATFDVAVAGGFEPGDVVILNVVSGSSFPSNMTADALRVNSTDNVKLRFCNVGSTNQTMVNQQIKMISLR